MMLHFAKKLIRTGRILSCLFMARMFGQYRHSGFNGEFPYARYTWRRRDWIIPTGFAQDEIVDRVVELEAKDPLTLCEQSELAELNAAIDGTPTRKARLSMFREPAVCGD